MPGGERARRGGARLQGGDGGAEQRAPRARERAASGSCKRAHQDGGRARAGAPAFGRPIGEFGLIKDKIATMMAETYALECDDVPDDRASSTPRSPTTRVESAICKVFGSRDAAGASSTRRCRSPPASATCRTTRTSGCCATRASTSSSRGPTRSCAASSRSRACRARARSSPTWRARCASRSRASACSATSRSARRARRSGASG